MNDWTVLLGIALVFTALATAWGWLRASRLAVRLETREEELESLRHQLDERERQLGRDCAEPITSAPRMDYYAGQFFRSAT
jgi:hypothetical protein